MAYNEKGEEILDQTPVEVPLEFRRHEPSIQELIAMYVRSEMQVREVMGRKSDDEEDLDVEGYDGDDILTPYELHALSVEADEEVRRVKELKEKVEKLRERAYNKSTVNKDRDKGDESGKGRGSVESGKGDAAGSGVEGAGRAGRANEKSGESVGGVAESGGEEAE